MTGISLSLVHVEAMREWARSSKGDNNKNREKMSEREEKKKSACVAVRRWLIECISSVAFSKLRIETVHSKFEKWYTQSLCKH